MQIHSLTAFLSIPDDGNIKTSCPELPCQEKVPEKFCKIRRKIPETIPF